MDLKKLSDLHFLRVLPHTWKEKLLHRQARKNLTSQYFGGFPVPSISIRSYPFCPIIFLYGCLYFVEPKYKNGVSLVSLRSSEGSYVKWKHDQIHLYLFYPVNVSFIGDFQWLRGQKGRFLLGPTKLIVEVGSCWYSFSSSMILSKPNTFQISTLPSLGKVLTLTAWFHSNRGSSGWLRK